MNNITAFVTERKEISLSADEARDIARKVIRLKFAIPEYSYVENDYLCQIINYGGNRNFKDNIRKLTDSDRAALLVLKELK